MSVRQSVRIRTEGVQVVLTSPFHPQLPAKARALGGRFDGSDRTWRFDARDEKRVRELALAIYGTEGEAAEVVTVRVDLGLADDHLTGSSRYGKRDTSLFLFGRELVALRGGRDSGVRLGDGVIKVAGDVASGGSRANPTISWSGAVLEVRDVPAGHPDLLTPGVSIVSQEVDQDALRAERKHLVARLAEIDLLLGQAGGG